MRSAIGQSISERAAIPRSAPAPRLPIGTPASSVGFARYNLQMPARSQRSRYDELKSQINFHNHRYHVLDAPVVSDAEYDGC